MSDISQKAYSVDKTTRDCRCGREDRRNRKQTHKLLGQEKTGRVGSTTAGSRTMESPPLATCVARVIAPHTSIISVISL